MKRVGTSCYISASTVTSGIKGAISSRCYLQCTGLSANYGSTNEPVGAFHVQVHTIVKVYVKLLCLLGRPRQSNKTMIDIKPYLLSTEVPYWVE